MLFQMQELLKIEATGHAEKTSRGHAIGMENLDS